MNNITSTTTGLTPRFSCAVTQMCEKLDDIVYEVNETVNDLVNHFIPQITKLVKDITKYKDIDDVKKLEDLVNYLPSDEQRAQLTNIIEGLKRSIILKEDEKKGVLYEHSK